MKTPDSILDKIRTLEEMLHNIKDNPKKDTERKVLRAELAKLDKEYMQSKKES
jgi:ribosome-interacting GTPase 1